MYQFIFYACFFAPVLVLLGFVIFQVVNAWRFGRRADQIMRPRIKAASQQPSTNTRQMLHIDDCRFDIEVVIGDSRVFVCEECAPYYERYCGARRIDRRGMPALKYQGPPREAEPA